MSTVRSVFVDLYYKTLVLSLRVWVLFNVTLYINTDSNECKHQYKISLHEHWYGIFLCIIVVIGTILARQA